MTAEENDAFRRALINQFHFGSRQPVPESGWTLATSAAVAVLSAEKRDRLMDRIYNCGAFDDDGHLTGTIDLGGVTATFELRHNTKTLFVAVG